MRECDNGDLRDLLPEWVHGRLDAVRADVVATHLAGCAACVDEAALIRRLDATLTGRTPAVNVAAIVAALPRPRARTAWHQRTQWRAAAVLLFMAGATSVAVFRNPSASEGDALATPAIEFAGGVSDLSERDLKTLVGEIDKLQATPAAEPDGASTVATDLPQGGA